MSSHQSASIKVETEISNLTVNNLTNNVKVANSGAPNARMKFLMDKLVDYLHNYVRETRLTNDEWLETIQFLTECGQKCTSIRQEFILLSDILGVSTLVDALSNPKTNNATESTLLGPFYTEDAPNIEHGNNIASDGKGEVCLILATIKNTKGDPIEGATVDVWETDGFGLYDNQYDQQHRPDMRGRLNSNKNGEIAFKCVKPVSYGVPKDGPVGKLLEKMHRHACRPAHIHFRIFSPNDTYDDLITTLYIHGDPYETNDAVFGVKRSLIVDAQKVIDPLLAQKYDVNENDWLIMYDFVLSTKEETRILRAVSS